VRRVAAGYTGDLRAGDRMLAVPARTMSLTGAWSTEAWSTSLTAYRAADWINYDRVALARVFLPGEPLPQPIGSQLREYWRTYDGFTHLRATATRALRPGVAFLISADNLLGRQVGEPDNITVVPGRTISLGVRASF
jgi:iron complex outermembrane receptor protein